MVIATRPTLYRSEAVSDHDAIMVDLLVQGSPKRKVFAAPESFFTTADVRAMFDKDADFKKSLRTNPTIWNQPIACSIMDRLPKRKTMTHYW